MNSTVTVTNLLIGGLLLGSTEDTLVGWTLGGGAVFAIADHFTMKAEALYFDPLT
jgi:hypothetical protein